MGEFIDTVSEFLQSDFAKDNRVVIVTFAIVLVVVTVVVVSLVFNKLIIPHKLRESGDYKQEYERVSAENNQLKNENGQLRLTKQMMNAANQEDEKTEKEKLDGWEKKFMKKN